MKMPSLHLIKLELYLTLQRFGIINTITSVLVLIGITLWFFVIPHLQLLLGIQHKEWIQAQQALRTLKPQAVPSRPQSALRLETIYNRLGDIHSTEQQLKIIFETAKKNNLVIAQAEYTMTENQSGHYSTYQIALPLKGTYRSIRTFSEHVLAAIPFASLDMMTFKRETIGATVLDAQLRFTLYLKEIPQPGFPKPAADKAS